jgi:hypothetical protein
VGTDEQEPHWMRTLKRIGAAAAALSTIAGLLFLLFPKCKPAEPPQKRSVILTDLQVQPGNIRRSDNSIVVTFRAQIEGHRGETLPVMWKLYPAATGKIARDSQSSQPPAVPMLGSWNEEQPFQRGSPTSEFKPTVQSDSLIGQINIPSNPSWEGSTVKITIEVTDAHGKPVSSPIGIDFLFPREPDMDPYGAWKKEQ